MVKLTVPAELQSISSGLDFIESTLEKYRFKRKEIQEAMLLTEESMVRLIDSADSGSTLIITIKRKYMLATINISAPGTELAQKDTEFDVSLESSDVGRENESAIRDILLRAYEDKIRYIRKGKYNFTEVTAGSPERAFAVKTMIAFLSAIVIGLILPLILKDDSIRSIDTYVLIPIENIFINCLKLATAPTVFFSIITCVAQYFSFSDPGKVSIKIFASYIATSICAIFIALGMFKLFQPGVSGQLAGFVEQTVYPQTADKSDIVQTIVNIVPSNVVDPFLNMDTLQLIFMALICGVALGYVGGYSSTIRNVVGTLNSLCLKITSLLTSFIPIATFAATVSVLFNVGTVIILSLSQMILTVFAGTALVIGLYLLVIAFSAHINPFVFLRKYFPHMKETFLIGSSVSAIPKTMRFCKNALGISHKVYTFSIPYGAIANLDGNCIYLTIAGLFLARVCGVELFGDKFVIMILTILVLSIGAPITPGSALLCLTVLLNQMGVSLSAAGIIIGINAVMEMLQAMSNTTGDVAVSLIVAKTENLLDVDTYYSKAKSHR